MFVLPLFTYHFPMPPFIGMQQPSIWSKVKRIDENCSIRGRGQLTDIRTDAIAQSKEEYPADTQFRWCLYRIQKPQISAHLSNFQPNARSSLFLNWVFCFLKCGGWKWEKTKNLLLMWWKYILFWSCVYSLCFEIKLKYLWDSCSFQKY